MSVQWRDLLQSLPVYLGGHLTVSVSALLAGVLISLPLGIAVSRRPHIAQILLTASGVIQTVPSLALLALMVPLLNGKIGFWPAFVALVLYSILPILADTVAGIRSVDRAIIEAARGMGMNKRQVLYRVELPLAAPVILSGIRTATVLVVGTATLVTTVGGASLGNYIFSGLESFNDAWTVFGCIVAALLAVVLDQLVHLLELASRRRSRWLAAAGAGGLLLAVAGSFYYPIHWLIQWQYEPPETADLATVPPGLSALYAQAIEHLPDLLQQLPVYLGGHVALSLSALAVGLVLSVPLGIITSRRPRLSESLLAIAGVLQTVPSLAMLALLVLVLQARIGFMPSFLALTLYSVLPILANTVVGMRSVEPALIEAARGLGMNKRQLLFRVELPLAAPLILSGVRTAMVLVVGTAVLVTPVGGRSLGNYIFRGLESSNYAATVFGCLFAALLAIVLDQLTHVLELAAERRNRRLAWVGITGLLLVAAGSLCYPTVRILDSMANPARVASGPFTEQHILNEVISQQLAAAGFRPDQRAGMSEGIQFRGLFHSQIDCIVNYSGNIWILIMKQEQTESPERVNQQVEQYLLDRYGVVSLGPLGFRNAYVFAMSAAEGRATDIDLRSIHSLHDLRTVASQGDRPIRIGGDMQFFSRPEWRHVKEAYGLQEDWFVKVSMEPTRMYDALANRQVDVIVAYSSDGRIGARKLEILQDPLWSIPPYDALLLVSRKAAANQQLVRALRPLVNAIPQQAMEEANAWVDRDKHTAGWAAVRLRKPPP